MEKPGSMSDVTQILEAVQSGDERAGDQLLPLVYAELRQLAASKLAREPAGQTLQATALVHEAWLRLVGGGNPRWDGRAHFFGAAAEAMRRILIDNARRKGARKRGAEFQRVELRDVDALAATTNETMLLFVHDVLDELAREDPASAELVKLRFFIGFGHEEAAEALGVSVRTAKRYWTFARAWLYDRLSREQDE
jgi:RNA polymerase sigma factor (TIGR02999 family)